MVSYRDVAGRAALVGAVEGAGLVCCGGEIDGADPYDEEVYLGRGVCRDSEGEEDLKDRSIPRKMCRSHSYIVCTFGFLTRLCSSWIPSYARYL